MIKTHRIGPVSIRVAWGAANFHSPRFDACGSGPPTAADLRRMMSDLDVSMLVFPLLSKASLIARAFAGAMPGVWWYRDFCESAPYVDCTGAWDAYLATRGKTRRKTWASLDRQAARAGLSIEMLSTWNDIERPFDQMLAVEASGWKGRLGSSIVQTPHVERFYREFCRDFADAGALRVFLLRHAERIVAFQICALENGVLTGLKSGYLEEHASDSPGQILHLNIVRWAFAQPHVRAYDMLGPASAMKMKWATGIDELSTIYVFRKSPGGALARLRWQIAPRLRSRLAGRRKARVAQDLGDEASDTSAVDHRTTDSSPASRDDRG
ncbi:MAG TPA: GNAT family N-acetyltransferase [Casimicrobiaceae bacterium]|nr:GNAT family N-acetyltransferase [Casimicrobiaceae bacterium]